MMRCLRRDFGEHVVVSLPFNEDCRRNELGQVISRPSSIGETLIAYAMQHEGWNADLLCQLDCINLAVHIPRRVAASGWWQCAAWAIALAANPIAQAP